VIPTAVVSARAEDRIRRGHPWIYQSDVDDVAAEAGAIVEVLGPRQRYLGRAFYSDQSQISLRMLTRGEEEVDQSFWRGRLSAALAFRESLGINATAYRLVHAEADLLPSLIVDRYGDVLVVQALSQGMDRHLPALLPILVELTGAAGVLARNDPRVRLLEGLEQRVDVLHGEVPDTISVHESGIDYDVDPRRGQKTGLFLDQRENRDAAALYARGRALDCFSYNGGFGLRLASRCEQVQSLDISADAVARTAANAARNRIMNVQARLVPWNRDDSHNSRAGHPGSRRCFSLRYAQYPRSARLAIRAPRSGIYASHHGSRGLAPCPLANVTRSRWSLRRRASRSA
jgi:23S rRNA (cytosine1962-C5)-methyltransferase